MQKIASKAAQLQQAFDEFRDQQVRIDGPIVLKASSSSAKA
jgi:hypothetical protein